MDPNQVGDTFATVLSSLTATGLIGTPQAQAAAQASQYGVSPSGLNFGSFQIPTTTLVLIALVVLGGLYFARHS